MYSLLRWWLWYKKTHAYIFEMSNNCIMFYDEHYMLRLMLLEINKNPHFPDTPRSNSTVPIESFLNIIWRRDTILMYLYNTTLHATLNFYFFSLLLNSNKKNQVVQSCKNFIATSQKCHFWLNRRPVVGFKGG